MYHYTVKRDLQTFGMSISRMNIMLFVSHLPWEFKFIPAIFCDIVPFCGKHRKPYIVASNALALLCVILLIFPKLDADSYITLLFFMNLFVCVADVNYDACIVEDGRTETTERRGTLQTRMWFLRFVGDAIGEICGPLIWAKYHSVGVYITMSITISIALFFSFFLADKRDSNIVSEIYHPTGSKADFNVNGEAPSVEIGDVGIPTTKYSFRKFDFRYSIKLIGKTILHPALRYILLYNIIVAMFPTTGLASFYYVTNELHFSPEQMSLLGLLSAVAKLVGISVYHFLRPYSIQSVYVFTSIIGTLVGLTSFIVTVRFSNSMTLAEFYGFDNFWCAITDDVIGDTLDMIRSMAILVVAGIVCELAVEAGAYSSILSLLNTFNSIRRLIESGVMDLFQINNESFGRLPDMVTLSISLRMLALVLIFPLIPDTSVSEIAEDCSLSKKQNKPSSATQSITESDNVVAL